MTFISHSQTRPVVVPLFSLHNVDASNETHATLTKTILAVIFIFAMVLSYPKNSTASQPHVNRKYTSKQPVSQKPLTCPEIPANDRWTIARHDGQTNFLFPLDTPITPTMLPPVSRTNLIHVYPATLPAVLHSAEQQDDRSRPQYEFHKSSDPAGTGKFFLGREIAQYMSYHGAPWLVRPEREMEEQPDVMLDSLNIQPGQTIADIGAGVGYFSLRLADRVGSKGQVLAVDIQRRMLALLKTNMRKAGVKNIRPILGSVKNPRLPTGKVDLVLMVDVYHEFTFPIEMILAIRQSLKPDGRIVFVEYRSEDPAVPIKRLHKMSERQVRIEGNALGLKWQETIHYLPWQHVVIFH